ncbi:MAG: threonine synthase [Actinobacteria bacterium]|nr:threonine synthase [Actinomycetota bacterium]
MSKLFYRSTRGTDNRIESSRAIVRGIATDGGLYVPEAVPQIDLSMGSLAQMDYTELALYIMSKFLTDFKEEELKYCIEKAYDKKFDDPRIAPLVEKGGAFFLELFHGPTLAFKDMALSIMPYLLKIAADKNSIDKEIVILTATSGDTGKAALEGFAGVEGTKIIVFYPRNGVSKIQERQMTTQAGDNTYAVAIEGNFDDAQRGVKEIFSDREFNGILNKSGYILSSANSINIGRLVPQVVYYVYAYLNLRKSGKIKSNEVINIVVPTGNFGNILAAYYSKKMGLPVGKLICASNENNVLYDFINTGVYDRKRRLIVTSSPSMDILVSSNLERLLYDISGSNADIINNLIGDLDKKGEFKITGDMKDRMVDFYGGFATDKETFETIKYVFFKFNYLIDTHTAVGYNVYQKYIQVTGDRSKTVIASTASPFEFPGSVAKAIDEKYAGMDDFSLLEVISEISGLKVPEAVKGLERRKILHNTVCMETQMEDVITDILGL